MAMSEKAKMESRARVIENLKCQAMTLEDKIRDEAVRSEDDYPNTSADLYHAADRLRDVIETLTTRSMVPLG